MTPAPKPPRRAGTKRLEYFVAELRGRCAEHETWEALRRVLAAIRGDWPAAEEIRPHPATCAKTQTDRPCLTLAAVEK